MLCNAGDFLGDELGRRSDYFATAVDNLYSRYYAELAERHFTATASAVGLWLGALALYGVGFWIKGTARNRP
jgi:hypothetical protein